MTLKQFLHQNKIKATDNDRCNIGRLISSENDSNGSIKEDGHRVKDYKESFLNDPKTQLLIIGFLSKNN